ncbi:MAG: hypothetical protein PF637_06120 [Spirochaetes bacterium]|jgi:hypothetical protein|nr:hypothetical protein [Spirochaetota bacterium]
MKILGNRKLVIAFVSIAVLCSMAVVLINAPKIYSELVLGVVFITGELMAANAGVHFAKFFRKGRIGREEE